ncbi:MAG: 3-methyl-2-oxobutanoate hydroxymethyltransferase [bacterium]
MPDRITIKTLQRQADRGEKIAMVTAYDAPSTKLAERAGADILLVGDSLGMVVLGYPNTLSVTLDDMLHHIKAVARVSQHALVIGDMPFMSYQVSAEQAVSNAGRLIQEGGTHAVKLEGGARIAGQIQKIIDAGIPVMGHLGLTPQSIHQFGGYKVQGKTAEAARQMVADAHLLESLGCFALVLECVPSDLAAHIARDLTIPVIGIGAGQEVDGQVLVFHDLLQFGTEYAPKFVRAYADLNESVPAAIAAFVRDVKAGTFPSSDEAYAPTQAVLEALEAIATQVEHDASQGKGEN